MATGRDDFVIAIRSAFLKKKDKQKFSLLTLICLSVFVIVLSNFNFKAIQFVKLGINEILDRKPDICVSGVNHGSNSSINVIYSGTMSAAVEASIEGIPAIGFSLLDYSWNADFNSIKKYLIGITKKALEEGIPMGNALNINFPKLKEKEIKGIKICRQANAYWVEKFDKRSNPQGKEYYWLTGEFINEDKGEDSDEWALENGYISIVPVKFDMTDHENIKLLKNWKF